MKTSEQTVSLEALFEPNRAAAHDKPPVSHRPAPCEMPVSILGVPIDRVTLGETLKLVEAMVASRQPHHIVTANVDFLVQARRDAELHRILLDAHLVLCDGTPLVWASRMLGHPLPERVAGADLVPQLLNVAEDRKYRLFLLGGTPDANAQAVANLRRDRPKLIIAGHSPAYQPLLEMDHDDIRRRIRTVRPDILLVCFGCPKQEKWIAMHYRSLGVPVVMGVGAVVDFLGGRVKRAPLWMRRSGTEWVFRLAQEPRRLFARYAADVWGFGTALAEQWRTMRSRPRRTGGAPRCMLLMNEPDWLRIRVPGRLDGASVAQNAMMWRRIRDRHCLLDLSDVEFVDGAGMGLLIRLHQRLQAAGRQLVLLAPSASVRRSLQWMHLSDYFALAADAVEARRVVEARRQDQPVVVAAGTARSLAMQGELTAANVGLAWEAMRPVLRQSCARQDRLLIDVSDVRFIDSTGVGLMVRAEMEAQRWGTRLRLIGATPPVRNVLRLTQHESHLLEDAA
jgi:N-acetylglucosaminyldiphosphoundecaprenol N-acetyl-beta-D-mannosaminyltransferase